VAKLYAELKDEKGLEVHKIGNKELCGTFFYGSKQIPLAAAKVCLSIKPSREGENAVLSATIYREHNSPIQITEEHPMPKRRTV